MLFVWFLLICRGYVPEKTPLSLVNIADNFPSIASFFLLLYFQSYVYNCFPLRIVLLMPYFRILSISQDYENIFLYYFLDTLLCYVSHYIYNLPVIDFCVRWLLRVKCHFPSYRYPVTHPHLFEKIILSSHCFVGQLCHNSCVHTYLDYLFSSTGLFV